MVSVKQAPHDLPQRYDRSFVEYEGRVYYCRVVEGEDYSYNFRLSKVSSPGSGEFVVDPYEDGLNSKSVRLGYVNNNGSATYVSRAPYRQWKQAVDVYTIKTFLGDSVFSSGVEQMLNNEYPSLDDALHLIDKGLWRSVAISRDIMIRKTPTKFRYEVFCKDREIGFIEDSTKDLSVSIRNAKLAKVVRPYIGDLKWKVA
jgi:hypothetical protein